MKKVRVSDFCSENGLSETDVLEQIRNKEIQGGPQMGVWFVNLDDDGKVIKGQEQQDVVKEAIPESQTHVKTPSEQFKAKHYRTPKRDIAMSTLDYLSGKTIVEIGLVSVSFVQSVNVFKSVEAEIRSQTIGGKSNSLSRLFDDTRDSLLDELQAKAHQMRADAVIGVRFTSTEVLQKALELMAYGTAVKVLDKSDHG